MGAWLILFPLGPHLWDRDYLDFLAYARGAFGLERWAFHPRSDCEAFGLERWAFRPRSDCGSFWPRTMGVSSPLREGFGRLAVKAFPGPTGSSLLGRFSSVRGARFGGAALRTALNISPARSSRSVYPRRSVEGVRGGGARFCAAPRHAPGV